MAGIFPQSWDGAIPPNPETPDNPPQARQPGPYTQPPDTSALYYGLGCDVRIRAPVLNSIVSEIVSVLEGAGIPYQAGRLNNLALAISLIAARGGALAAIAPVANAEPDSTISLRAELRKLRTQVDVLKQEIAALKTTNAKVAA